MVMVDRHENKQKVYLFNTSNKSKRIFYSNTFPNLKIHFNSNPVTLPTLCTNKYASFSEQSRWVFIGRCETYPTFPVSSAVTVYPEAEAVATLIAGTARVEETTLPSRAASSCLILIAVRVPLHTILPLWKEEKENVC